jgi:hypothetical protein
VKVASTAAEFSLYALYLNSALAELTKLMGNLDFPGKRREIDNTEIDKCPDRIDTSRAVLHHRPLAASSSKPGKDNQRMGKKLYPADTLDQAKDILIAWEQIDPALKIGPLSQEALAADLERVHELRAKILQMQVELIDIRNERDQACLEIWDQVKRVRSGIKGLYGDDSSEYEIAGGTRMSEKKRRRRTPSA